jgi:glycosyltransferase involved in cell wall biosynthesis
VHIVPALFGPEGVIGGAERYAYELARHMAERTPTTLLSFGRARAERVHGSLRIVVLGPVHYVRGQRSNPVARGLVRAVLDSDVIHCHQQHIVASSLAAVVARIARRRVFATDLGGGGWDVSGYFSTDRWFHAHLHISEYSREVAGHSDSSRAHVIYGGVDTSVFSPAPDVRRDGTVRFVGRVLPHKGLADLIDAAGSDLPLDIVGPQLPE